MAEYDNETGKVALLAEGVDRNLFAGSGVLVHLMSPSSRRAWIEISKLLSWNTVEGVDRNIVAKSGNVAADMSPSSRRAWIEIDLGRVCFRIAPSPSSRRAWIEICTT